MGVFYEDCAFLATVYFINTVYKSNDGNKRLVCVCVHGIRWQQAAGYYGETFYRAAAAELYDTDGEAARLWAYLFYPVTAYAKGWAESLCEYDADWPML